jgi:hypothetical protein
MSSRSAEREAHEEREHALSTTLCDPVRKAIVGQLPFRAISHCAEEDVNAVVNALSWDLNEAGLALLNADRIADFLLSYSADGDRGDPWQDGHNYAMREAARMVRERWFEMGAGAGEPHFREDGPNGETTGCDCPRGADHDAAG